MATPLQTQAACVRQESETFLERIFYGGAAALLTHFAKSERLSAEELASWTVRCSPSNPAAWRIVP